MKTLLFTHEQYIDSPVNTMLIQQAFKEVDYISCKKIRIEKMKQ